MGQSQLLIIAISILIVGIAILSGAGFFQADDIDANKKAMIDDFHHIAINAVRYFKRIPALGGGGNRFDGYSLPNGYRSNLNGRYTASVLNPQTLQVSGVSSLDTADTMIANIDPSGKASSWTFAGDFQ